MDLSKLKCPLCGGQLRFKEKPGNPRRLVGTCDCTVIGREVVETDNLGYVSDQDVLEPAEPLVEQVVSTETKKTKKRKQ